MSRIVALLSLLLLAACSWASEPPIDKPAEATAQRADRIQKTEAEWKAELTAEQFHILREQGTERAFTGRFWNDKSAGVYVCAACGLELFHSDDKFKSGTGWPSYTRAIAESRVDENVDGLLGMSRTELSCARCGGHLGHVFNDGPQPTGMRYCINSASLDKVPAKKK